ncbi:MAG: hypothetical protein A2W25_04205 [candidate division Zixibacteria bacterium RBG_16_53_22]|nr:MAG: hypothetical protein A2W25_04205 [candidate division Zixibacteria bacterium RBG_16_53_22]
MGIKWAVLVSDPDNQESMKLLLQEVGERPDTFTQDGVLYFIHSKHTCILDATTEAVAMKRLGWKKVDIHPIP